jgi:hypothetical protein
VVPGARSISDALARRDGGRHTDVTAANSASKSLASELHQQRLPIAVVVVVVAVVIVICATRESRKTSGHVAPVAHSFRSTWARRARAL